MSDEQPNPQLNDAGANEASNQDLNTNRRSGPARRDQRRPRPSAAYTTRRRAPVEQPSGIGALLVPISAVIALAALIAAVVFDHVHNNPSNPAAAPTAT